ncbi:spermidine/putrescine ABC transporter permease [Deinococcus ruber]|uniref:Spermidine/putrescine ABC transporter permease n=1 Tax=Deinococcus ruber TaxID=1848197 RepID=A0A918C9V5_9DEIO|nr:spermidine/putrescine ABC transporter permease [Deinococcus ruber]
MSRPAPRKQTDLKPLLGLLFLVPPLAVLTLLVLLPAFDALRFSLGWVPEDNVSYASGLNLIRSSQPTLAVFGRLFSSASFGRDLGLTLFVTLTSVALLTVVSYALAVYARFGRGRWVGAVRTLYLLPMFIPGIIAAYAITTFYGDHGLLQAMLERVGVQGYHSPIRQSWGIVLGSVWTGIPFAVLMLSSGLDGVAEEQIEAARDAGASFWVILWRIVLPLNLVPLLIVLTFSFIGVFGSFTIPYLLGPAAPNMLGVSMQLNFGAFRQPQVAVAMAVFSFLVCALVGYLYVVATLRQNGRRV